MTDNSLFTFTSNAQPVPLMEFKNNGDMYVQGRFVTNDMEVVEGIKAFLSAAKPDDHKSIFTEQFLKEELADAGKMYLVSDQQLRRLLRYSTVMTFQDCRMIKVPSHMVDLIIEKD